MATLTGEIHERIIENEFTSRIAEMGPYDPTKQDGLPVDDALLAKIKEDDENPMFVTIEVESGVSKSKRNWKPEIVHKVVKAVNERNLGGNLGHPLLDPEKFERDFPKPQVLWVAASARDIGSKTVAKFKGYVLKSAEAREYLRLGLIDGVSWFGDSTMKRLPGGGFDVLEFHPETIDFARKGRSGMPSRVLALTGEMEGGNAVEAKDIAALDEQELRTHNPLLVREIERKASEPFEAKVGEMTTAVETLTPQAEIASKIRELLKLPEGANVVEKVEALLQALEDATASEIKAFIKETVAKKVKTDRGQALVHRLLGEMHTEYSGELDDDMKAKIEADIEEKMDKDEDIKALVGEMAPFNETRERSGGRGGSTTGGHSRGGSSREKENDRSRTGSLRVTKRKL